MATTTHTQGQTEPMHRIPSVTVGVRFHDARYMPLLNRCLASIAAQQDVVVHLIVCTQGFADSQIRDVESLCTQALRLTDFQYQVVNVPNPGQSDLRAQLLNEIVARHYSTQAANFLAFMDYDDIWFSHALRTLCAAFAYGDFALSYADIHCADVFYAEGKCYVRGIKDVYGIRRKYKRDLLVDNFLPLHSYVFDTSIIARDVLRYDEELPVLEDYDLLIAVASRYPISGLNAATMIGLYNFYTTPTIRINTTENVFSNGAPQRDPMWDVAKRRVWAKHGAAPIHHFCGEEWRA